jgi:hypothetical protein
VAQLQVNGGNMVVHFSAPVSLQKAVPLGGVVAVEVGEEVGGGGGGLEADVSVGAEGDDDEVGDGFGRR